MSGGIKGINLSVLADPIRAQSNTNVQLRLKSSQGLIATEKTSGFNVVVVNSAGKEVTNIDFNNYVVQAGKVSITSEPYSLGNLSYAPGSKEAVLLSTRFSVNTAIQAQGLMVRFDSQSKVMGSNGQALSGAAAITELNQQIQNLTLYVNND